MGTKKGSKRSETKSDSRSAVRTNNAEKNKDFIQNESFFDAESTKNSRNSHKTSNSNSASVKPKRSQKMENKIKAAKRLIETCERELFNVDYGTLTIRGVENLSRSDVDTIIVYCEYFIKNKTIGGLMPPVGAIAEVLRKIEIVDFTDNWFI